MRFLTLLLVFGLAAITLPAQAGVLEKEVGSPALALGAAAGRLANVEVYDRNTGLSLPLYTHEGRLYVPGEPKHEYEIRIRSTTGARVLAVTSVDGVNVLTGKTASPEQSGYVLDARGSVDIAGWRKSLDRIATFYFTALKDSYAARTGRPGDVGVIGVALFREKQPCCWPWLHKNESDGLAPQSYDRSDSAPAAAPGASAGDNNSSSMTPAPSSRPEESARDSLGAATERRSAQKKAESKLGTGHGRSEHSTVVYTEFERASETPDEVIAIYYDSHRNLVAQGVIPVYSRYEGRRPNPFPNGFVPDP